MKTQKPVAVKSEKPVAVRQSLDKKVEASLPVKSDEKPLVKDEKPLVKGEKPLVKDEKPGLVKVEKIAAEKIPEPQAQLKGTSEKTELYEATDYERREVPKAVSNFTGASNDKKRNVVQVRLWQALGTCQLQGEPKF